jgi:Flp pilus assembly protein TadG
MNRMGKEFLGNESGAVAVICAALLVVFCGFAALAVDYGKIVYMRRELAKAAEAGALSGARGLWPQDLSTATRGVTNWSDAETKARTTATTNLPTPKPENVFTDVVTVKVGQWDYSNTFTENHANPNSVQVTIRRNNVPTSFAQALFSLLRRDHQPIDIERGATAVMDFATAVGAGALPIAVNKPYTVPDTQLFINFTPDPMDNGGWFSDTSDPASAKTFKDYINNLGLDNDKSCPPLVKDVSIINLQNGEDTSVLDLLAQKLAASTTTLPDGTKYLDTTLPVVDTDKFNHSELVRDFVPVRITKVDDKNPKGVTCKVLPAAEYASGRPGTGTLAPPKLVN